jgi:hypothetical protein
LLFNSGVHVSMLKEKALKRKWKWVT